MGRTVKVDLLLEVGRYLRGARDAERSTKSVADGLADAAKSGDRTATAVDAAGEAMRQAARDASRLDREIEQAGASLRSLAGEYARAGDAASRVDLAKKLREQHAELRRLAGARSLLGGDDGRAEGVSLGARLADGVKDGLMRAGGGISDTLGKVMGTLPPQAQAGIGAGVLAAAGIAAPALGAMVSAAVVGGVGAAGVVGGLSVAARHPAVKAAAQEVGNTWSDTLRRSASAFVPAAVAALDDVQAAAGRAEGPLTRIFDQAAQSVDPLVDGLISMAENALPGIEAAVGAAGPVLEAAADGLAELGTTFGDVLTELSEHEDTLVSGMSLIMDWANAAVTSLGMLLDTVTTLAGPAIAIYELFNDDERAIRAVGAAADGASASGQTMTERLRELAGGLQTTGSAASSATVSTESFVDALARMRGETLSAMEAELRMEEAVTRLGEAARSGAGGGLDIHTEAGKRNMAAAMGLARATESTRAAILASTGSHDLAAAATERGRQKFLAAAAAMGVERGEARRLADQLFGIPTVVNSRANFTPDNASVAAWKRTLSGIDRNIFTSARLRGIVDIEVRREQATQATGRRWGGVTEHARHGLLRDADVFTAVNSGARYAFAEPATGGEAFVPRFGDRTRSLSILDHAAGWYGATVQPASRYTSTGGGSTSITTINVRVDVPEAADPAEVGRRLMVAIRAYEQRNGRSR